MIEKINHQDGNVYDIEKDTWTSLPKSKLETLLEAIRNNNNSRIIMEAYFAYIEERKTIPQAGQEIEVLDVVDGWVKREFVGWCPSGKCLAYNKEHNITAPWKHYRIPVPKKKWKVVIGANGLPFNILEEDYIAGDIITTFEY
jgi:hypothetical protein